MARPSCCPRPNGPDGQWLFDGYRLNLLHRRGGVQTEAGLLGMSWFLETRAEERGRVFDTARRRAISHWSPTGTSSPGRTGIDPEATADAVIRSCGPPPARLP